MFKFKTKQAAAISNGKKGFTLLELLIVIAILAILGTVLVLVLNPAETLKKSRDTQRISDLATLKTAIGLYVTTTTTPLLNNVSGNTTCKNGSGVDTIYYGISTASTITDSTLDGGTGSVPAAGQVAASALTSTDATGWMPVNFTGMTGGSPISALPTDPTNTISSLSGVASSDLVYRYMCDANDVTFEIDARLESSYYGPGSSSDDKSAKDGGNNSGLYETGTKLTILGTGTDF